jgi:glycerol dehydrogenase-like iron-containing ADH family enzyme
MADLWPLFSETLEGPGFGGVHLVQTLDVVELDATLAALPTASSVIGVGGGQAIDVAKFIAWRRRLPLFQVPTAMTVNAPFGIVPGCAATVSFATSATRSRRRSTSTSTSSGARPSG